MSVYTFDISIVCLFCFSWQKDFFQLKELERMCQKEKGITSMSVKEILTSLVDDGMVDTDKIGTSVYFWAFPSKASQNVSNFMYQVQGWFRGPGFDTRSGNILSFLLPLFQKGQLSVTGESMCTKYWLTA